MNASDFGVPQLRPRVVVVAVRRDLTEHFSWPQASDDPPKTVGETLYGLMAANGWNGAKAWAKQADEIAPTIVGGSHKRTAVPISAPPGRGARGRHSVLMALVLRTSLPVRTSLACRGSRSGW